LGLAFHRPRFFGKTFASIVAQGIYGGNKIVDCLDFVGYGLGFNAVYYCPTRLGVLKAGTGKLFDWMSASMTRNRE
jgi:hypothetical protein